MSCTICSVLRAGMRDTLPAQPAPGTPSPSRAQGMQEPAQFGISLHSIFTPISDWDQPKGNTMRMFANNRARTVTCKGVQCHQTPGGVGNTRVTSSSRVPAPLQPQKHWLSSRIGS